MERVLHARECRAMGVRAVLQLAVVVGWAGLYCLSSRSLALHAWLRQAESGG
jgi:hypothetical protein